MNTPTTRKNMGSPSTTFTDTPQPAVEGEGGKIVRQRSPRNGSKSGAGFSTLELMMGFVVLTLALTTVIMVVFGNQSVSVDTELAQRGTYLAEKNLEEAGIKAQTDFDGVTSTLKTNIPDSPFSIKRDVLDISPCAKQVTDEVFWERGLRNLSTKLSSVFVSTETSAAMGGGCSPTAPSSDWDTPKAFGSVSSSDFDAQGTGVGIATVEGTRFAFLTTNQSSSNPSKYNFYSIDTNDPQNIDFEGTKVSNEALNGIAVGSVGGGTYAFVVRKDTSGQLQVVDVSDSDPANHTHVSSASSTLPYVTPGENPIPHSIFYYDEKVYIGTEYLAFGALGFNHELHVYDVSTPGSPSWETSINIDRRVNDVFVRDGVAYAAIGPGTTAPYTPFKIFDLSSGSEIGSFEISNAQEGTSIYLLGNTVYLGLEKGTTEDDFYMIDISDPTDPTELASESLGGNNTVVGDIVVQGPLAFLGMEGIGGNHTLQVWNILDPSSIWRVNTCVTMVPPLPQNITGLAFMDNYIFGSFRSNETFRIIHDDPTLSCS